MPRKVTISAEVGVLMNTSSVPAALEYCREWARKMLRLQKPEPWVDFTGAPACATPLNSTGPMAMLMVLTAAAPLRKRRRDAAGTPEKSISESLGKCVQPKRSHMMWSSLISGVGGVDLARSVRPDDSPAAAVNGRRHRKCRHANRREPLMRPALGRKAASAVPRRVAARAEASRRFAALRPPISWSDGQILFANRR